MTRYYFHIRGAQYVEDLEGIELSGDAAADRFARESVRDLMRDAAMHGQLPLSHSIDIARDGGAVVARVPFVQAMTVS